MFSLVPATVLGNIKVSPCAGHNSVRCPGNVNNFTSVISWRLKLLGGVLTSSSYCTGQYKGFAMCGAVTAGLQISKIFQIDKKDDLSG